MQDGDAQQKKRLKRAILCGLALWTTGSPAGEAQSDFYVHLHGRRFGRTEEAFPSQNIAVTIAQLKQVTKTYLTKEMKKPNARGINIHVKNRAGLEALGV